MPGISASSPPTPPPLRTLLSEVIRGLRYGFVAYLVTALYTFSFPGVFIRLFQEINETVLGAAVYPGSYAHVCPDETELVVEHIPNWGHFYYCERVELNGDRIKHGPWVYWGKFDVKLRQGQFENGKKVGLWYSWKGVGRTNYRVDEYRDDELLFVRHYHLGKQVRVFTLHKGRLLELEQA